jgi:hypothetical protein
MKAIAAILMLLTTKLAAQWLVVKPAEFEPLTSLPWHVEDATRETVLGAVFREADADIRYRVLGEYLKRVPADDMPKVSESCVPLEGTQNPDELVALFIRSWAKRDPLGCWDWTKKLFQLTAIEHSVLGYDSWNHPRINAKNPASSKDRSIRARGLLQLDGAMG